MTMSHEVENITKEKFLKESVEILELNNSWNKKLPWGAHSRPELEKKKNGKLEDKLIEIMECKEQSKKKKTIEE